jgi:hypothetical protein
MEGKCGKLGKGATKAELEQAQRDKQWRKKMLKAGRSPIKAGYVFANQSQHHPEFGETPADQAKRMAEKSS